MKPILIGLSLALCAALGLYFLTAQNPTTQYVVDARVNSINALDGVIFAHHEEIPDYMEAMIMPFSVKDKTELDGIEGGDAIRFTLNIDETAADSWISEIKRIPNKELQLPEIQKSPNPESKVKVILPNENIPNASFVNQDNQPISFADFKGKNLLITFIFTRCPLPNLCPRMSKNMKEVAEMATLEDNLQLLSLSFDPLHDTPQVLKEYATKYGADGKKWQFATAPLAEMTAICEQFGVTAIKSPEILIQHTLVSALIDKEGKLIRRWTSNDWKPEKVLEELRLNQ